MLQQAVFVLLFTFLAFAEPDKDVGEEFRNAEISKDILNGQVPSCYLSVRYDNDHYAYLGDTLRPRDALKDPTV
jgi:hypothetical protein